LSSTRRIRPPRQPSKSTKPERAMCRDPCCRRPFVFARCETQLLLQLSGSTARCGMQRSGGCVPEVIFHCPASDKSAAEQTVNRHTLAVPASHRSRSSACGPVRGWPTYIATRPFPASILVACATHKGRCNARRPYRERSSGARSWARRCAPDTTVKPHGRPPVRQSVQMEGWRAMADQPSRLQPLDNGLYGGPGLVRRARCRSVTERRTISGNTGCPEMKEAAKVK
jgi:hypothetical protein